MSKIAQDVTLDHTILHGEEQGAIDRFGPLARQIRGLFAKVLRVGHGDRRILDDTNVEQEAQVGQLRGYSAERGPCAGQAPV